MVLGRVTGRHPHHRDPPGAGVQGMMLPQTLDHPLGGGGEKGALQAG